MSEKKPPTAREPYPDTARDRKVRFRPVRNMPDSVDRSVAILMRPDLQTAIEHSTGFDVVSSSQRPREFPWCDCAMSKQENRRSFRSRPKPVDNPITATRRPESRAGATLSIRDRKTVSSLHRPVPWGREQDAVKFASFGLRTARHERNAGRAIDTR